MEEKININLNLTIEYGEDPQTPDEDISVMIDYQGICEDVTEQLLEALIKPEHLDKTINLVNSQLN